MVTQPPPTAQTPPTSAPPPTLSFTPTETTAIAAYTIHPNPHLPHCTHAYVAITDSDANTTQFVPITCGRWSCPDCAERKAATVYARIRQAKPERHVTLTCHTQAFSSPAEALKRMKSQIPRLRQELKEKGYTFEYALIWERFKNGYPHAHLSTWGDYIPQSLLSDIWARLAYSPIVWIERLTDTSYSHHKFTKYLLKRANVHYSLFEHSRRVQFSNGYHRYPRDTEQPEERHGTSKFYTSSNGLSVILTLASTWMLDLAIDTATGKTVVGWGALTAPTTDSELVCLLYAADPDRRWLTPPADYPDG